LGGRWRGKTDVFACFSEFGGRGGAREGEGGLGLGLGCHCGVDLDEGGGVLGLKRRLKVGLRWIR
jgi:hypothetical protein